MLSYAAIIPGSPLFLDGISQETEKITKQQNEHINEILDEIYSRNAESLVLLLPGKEKQSNFEIMASEDFTFDLSDFGELEYPQKIKPDFSLIDRIQRSLRKENFQVMLETHEHLPFQAAPILTKLLKNLDIKIVPITVPKINHKNLFAAGKILKEILHNNKKRTVVIAAGDAFHENQESDTHLSDLVKSLNATGLIHLENTSKQEIVEQIITLFGIIDMQSVTLEHFSHQNPLGTGFITAGFEV